MKSLLRSMTLIVLAIAFYGCEEGPFGNNAPQGRPQWMKEKEAQDKK